MGNSRLNKRTSHPYPACRALLGASQWDRLAAQHAAAIADQALSAALERAAGDGYPGFLSSLARLDEAGAHVQAGAALLPQEPERPLINPTLRIVDLPWKNLAPLLDPGRARSSARPVREDERVLLWYDPSMGRVRARPATDEDLLVLKMIVEEIPPESVASLGGLPVGAVDEAVSRAFSSGLLLAPPSRIRRDAERFSCESGIPEQYLSSPSFTLQWHITQTCDLHCKHCYDRSSRSEMKLDQALRILDGLRAFCRSKNVAGAVSFTGGNPLLHPEFTAIYRAAAERGFSIAILGNPSPAERIAELIAIRMPAFYQVSLEGLREHNDAIRGTGHFDRVLSFLEVLRSLKVYSMVMLTLTSANIDQVIPLAETLRGKADIFHFNRLSRVGEGADLRLPDPRKYQSFLHSYLKAAKTNPVMGIKDNLINIIRREQGEAPFGGCTGYGCGAAFNFVSLLADGEVHACRKFPSLIGNIHQQSLAQIYDSDEARLYRSGTSACRSCSLHPVCGGCLASAHSHGLNVLTDKDPFCFKTLS
jgi:selenobiotic family peptide radical SAM maturase